MKYEVRAIMFFDEDDEARDFFHDCTVALPKAIVLHPCEENQECSRVQLMECNHDVPVNEPCIIIDQDNNCPICD